MDIDRKGINIKVPTSKNWRLLITDSIRVWVSLLFTHISESITLSDGYNLINF